MPNGPGVPVNTTTDARQFGAVPGKEWRITPNLTLNLGVRYDTLHLMDQENPHQNATRQVLEAIAVVWWLPPKRQSGHLAARRLRV